MKSIKSVLLALLLLGPTTALVANAQHGGGHGGGGFHGGGFHGGGFHGGHGRGFFGFGFGLGLGLALDPWLYYPYAYGYYPYGYYPYGYTPYAYPAAPAAYIEQGAAPAAPAGNDWYYCHNPEGYYPYVRNCPGGWQTVPSQPPVQR